MDTAFANIEATDDGKFSINTNIPYAELYLFLAQTMRQLESGEMSLPPEE